MWFEEAVIEARKGKTVACYSKEYEEYFYIIKNRINYPTLNRKYTLKDAVGAIMELEDLKLSDKWEVVKDEMEKNR